MSLEDCIQRAADDGLADKQRSERAQAMWRDLRDQYERQGHNRNTAEALAAEDVKEAFRREAGDVRHVYMARISNMRAQQAKVANAKTPDMIRTLERMDYEHRALLRRFNSILSDFLKEHHRDLLGRNKNPIGLENVLRELRGESSGDEIARAFADALRAGMEDMRLTFNELGGLIGKREDWGVSQKHDRLAIRKAGFEAWFAYSAPKIDWKRVDDPLTGRPMQGEAGPAPELASQRAFLKEAYDNIVFGKEAREAVYGRPQGVATYRKHSERRVLHFKTTDDWLAYNRKFGSGGEFGAIMGHVHRMARDIVLMREFGPNPGLGIEYRRQLWEKKARDMGDADLKAKVATDSSIAGRMFRILSGGSLPQNMAQERVASFFSTARLAMTSAFLDRAIISAISDLNTMRLAAQSVGMNPRNVISTHVRLMANSMAREDALRAGWVADTMADAGVNIARFQQEFPAAEWAERLASGSMRIQGLSFWTDMGRVAFQSEFAGMMASQAGKALDQVDEPLQGLLKRAGVTAEEWDVLRAPETLFKAGNGATFLSPIYWREATDLPRQKADDLFFKVQGMIEQQMELAIPTQSLLGRGVVDPVGYDLPPGSVMYEIGKSGLMFKSFPITFSINQYRRIMAQPDRGFFRHDGKMAYFFNLAAGATIMGSLALQIGEIAMGRDPQPMDNGAFWARAALKGGGFGIIGDIAMLGQTTWGGGLPTYLAGPMAQAGQDVIGLTADGIGALLGQDVNLPSEIARLGKRYTPMGQTPLIGPALDRLWWDQMQLLLDPESIEAMQMRETRRQNLYGNESFWVPGEVAPSRLPTLSSVLGGA